MNREIAGYGTFFMPNVTGFSGIFPYVPTHQKQNLYVFLPTANPMEYNFAPKISNVENSFIEEEIFPDFRCKSCSIAIPTYPEYEAHLATHNKNTSILHGEPNSSKDQLSRNFYAKKKVSILKPLVKNKDSLHFRCLYCPETFKLRSELAVHINKHPDIKKVFCTICKSEFAGISSLRKHLLMFHCKNRDRKPCPYCSYRCFQSSDLEKHIARRHTRDFKFKCSYCVKGFATPKELNNHARRRHPDVIKVVKTCSALELV